MKSSIFQANCFIHIYNEVDLKMYGILYIIVFKIFFFIILKGPYMSSKKIQSATKEIPKNLKDIYSKKILAIIPFYDHGQQADKQENRTKNMKFSGSVQGFLNKRWTLHVLGFQFCNIQFNVIWYIYSSHDFHWYT